MPAQILSGREVADALMEELRPQIEKLDPKLVIVQVGNDPGSTSYIRQKLKSCAQVGMRHEHLHFDETLTYDKLMSTVDKLNKDPDVSGFIVQLPLPKHLEKYVPQIIRSIDPKKDVDGFGAYNLGKMFLSQEFEDLPPATPSGVIRMLEHYRIPIQGEHVVIVGRSNIVGKPLAVMMLNRGATVTVCHSKTPDLKAMTLQANILCVAVGRPKLITADMIKPGTVVIDIGMNRVDGKLCGDVDFDSVKEIAGAITPIPGGVGPMTVASLIRNTLRAKERQLSVI